MVVYTMKIAASAFEKIVSGNKRIESRLFDEKRQQINPGDYIEFTCIDEPEQKVVAVVSALYRYSSFKEMFSGFSPLLFGGTSSEELLKEIKIIYPKEERDKYGVIGIKIEVVK